MKKVLFIFSCLILLLVMGCSSPTTPEQPSITETTREDGVIEIKAATFAELKRYFFETDKKYCIHINKKIMSHAGEFSTELNSFIQDNQGITEVIIDKDVTEIEEEAFYLCTNLATIKVDANNNSFSSENGVLFNNDKTTLITYPEGKTGNTYTIPDTVTEIGYGAFQNCRLTSIEIPENVKTIGEMAFFACEKLTTITLLDGVTEINNLAFSNCINLTTIKLPTSVTKIGNSAFYSCEKLTTITLPASVTEIDNDAFFNCKKLTIISVDSNNNSFSSENGVLFNNDKTTLITYPEGKTGNTYTIPNTVTKIGYGAFQNCSLTSIDISENVTTIDKLAFYSCKELTTITLPASVTKIYSSAFSDCNNLKTINYTGTQADWDKIKGITNAIIPNGCNITCTDGSIIYQSPTNY